MENLRKQVGPAWFQELSKSQIAAADSLFEAVSDETEKCQYQRCRRVLIAIGLSPLPEKADVTAAIRFSRNNDLAFLWSLYESVYNPSDKIAARNCFSLNERLILSSICHLDMMTTLRELNRILPKPINKISKQEDSSQTSRKALKYANPYDEPVPKPKLQPERCYPPPQRKHPKFELYQKYKDPTFVILNESNRWFAKEQLLPTEAQNITKEIICQQINKVDEGRLNHDMIMNGLCVTHRKEATKFKQLLTKALNKTSEVDLSDYGPFERGVIYGILIELEKTEENFRNNADQQENQVMMITLIRQMLENAADLKYIHLCKKCEECVKPESLCCKVSNQHLNISKLKENKAQSNDENQIKFFHRPSPTSPFEFDYEKIFTTSFLNDCGVVRNSINTALKLDKHLTEDNAITVCLQDMWQSQLKEWNENHQRACEEKQQRVVADCEQIGKNKRKIFHLLSKGIALMRRNPKYVLASLPNADRLPLLREWILHRFGIRYTDKDNEERWKINKYQRDIMDVAGQVPELKVPEFPVLGIKKQFVPLDETLRRKKKVKTSFFLKF